MSSIRTTFLLIGSLLALTFSSFILYHTWSMARAELEASITQQAELALEFDLAIRQYVLETIRPIMQACVGKDEFIVETMSSSFVARSVFEKVRRRLPSYVIKFSSDNPRNPVNRAGPEETRMIQYFRDHPKLERWSGRITLDGKEYWACLSPMRAEKGCLRCHGRPEDAPASLVARYGSTAGFHRPVGDVIALDTVAIPLDRVNAAIAAETTTHLMATAIGLGLLFAAVVITFHYAVGRRLTALTEHLRLAAEQAESVPIAPCDERGRDEIGVLANSFNVLAARLRVFHASLEQRVAERTAELESEVAERRRAEEALKKEQQSLRRLLEVYEGHRMLVAYELHDGVTQALIGALMNLEASLSRVSAEMPAAAEKGFAATRQLLRQSIEEARRMISGLRPSVLDELGIVPALESLVLEHQCVEGPEVEFVRDVHFERLAAPLETAIYRIVQEGLVNACRHSRSKTVRIGLFQDGDRIRVEIEDWGIGFDPKQIDSGHFGLEGIRKRAEMFAGHATIQSVPGQGTRIVVDLPLVERTPEESWMPQAGQSDTPPSG